MFLRARLNSSRRIFLGAIGYLLTGQLLMTVIHISWFFDLDGFQTGSSTSGLVLLFGPLVIANRRHSLLHCLFLQRGDRGK